MRNPFYRNRKPLTSKLIYIRIFNLPEAHLDPLKREHKVINKYTPE
jgi:hypothetical protein